MSARHCLVVSTVDAFLVLSGRVWSISGRVWWCLVVQLIFSWFSLVFGSFPWFSLVVGGFPWFGVVFHSFLLFFHGFYWFLAFSMVFGGFPWFLGDLQWFLGGLQCFLVVFLREASKYYFADFVRKGGTPPPFTDFFSGKKGVTDLGGTPPPLRIFFCSKMPKNGVFCPKTPVFW